MAPFSRLLLLQHHLTSSTLPNPAGPAPRLGAVATENTHCSKIGADLLRTGGSAADAMAGALLCVGVVGMYHAGIGGGGFALVRAPNGSFEHIDFREAAPRAARRDMFDREPARSVVGGLAAGVPGELRGLAALHARYGRLPWRGVVMPAVRLAREGWPVNRDLVRYMGFANLRSSFLTSDPNWALDFAPQGKLLGLGDRITRKRYAATLETIAKSGPEAFYSGPIADATIAELKKQGGSMTVQDLKDYKVVIRKPVEINYRGYRLVSCGAPASGSVVLAAMATVEGYGDFGWPEAVNISTHRLDESMRFAYGLRTRLGDPLFVEGMSDYESYMTNFTTIAKIRSRLSDDKTHNVSFYDPKNIDIPETQGTSQISVIDGDGMAISLTSTINLIFGNRVMVPETGVIMNNEMDDFSIRNVSNSFGYIASPANYIQPGKRPLSSCSPVIVETPDGRPYFIVGAAGGSRIPTATILTLRNVLDLNMTLPDALAASRFHDQLIPNTVQFEWANDNGTTHFMQGRGHNVTWLENVGNIVHAVRRFANGTFEAVGDPRQADSAGYAV